MSEMGNESGNESGSGSVNEGGNEATLRIRADKVVAGAAVLDHAVVTVSDGEIVEISPGTGLAANNAALDPDVDVDHHGWLLPGFVDTHVHGGGGASLAGPDRADVLTALGYFRRHGTTSSFASLVTAEPDTLVDQLGLLAPLVDAGELAGIHLEGPFLSPERRGAHQPAMLIAPEPALIERLLTAGDGTVRMVTIAPELPGALAAIEQFVEAGVTVAIGHTAADETITARALDAGARVATHLFNAMGPIHHREPGPVPRLLTDPRCLVELVCDGVHLHPDVIALAIAAAGVERTALITDAMIATGMPDGRYRLGGLDVTVTDRVARLTTGDGAPGSIAGSTLTMAGAVAFVVEHCGVSLADAAQLAAATPARWHGLEEVGEIAPGRRADLVLTDDTGALQRVLRAGRWIETDPAGSDGSDELDVSSSARRERGDEAMTLVQLTEVLDEADRASMAVGAFNVISIEHAEALVAGAEQAGTAVILQISENAVKYHRALAPIGLATLAIGRASSAPVVVHLDHAVSTELVDQAVELGFGSVMFDASELGYDENVAATADVVRRCHAHGLGVEAELGEVGGKDGVHAPGARTRPDEAVSFVDETGVDALAVAVGSSHAMTQRTAQLDLDLIGELREALAVPLVLHGSSGVPDDELVRAVRAGMRKINIGTHLNVVFTGEVRARLAGDDTLVDTRKYLGPARDVLADEVARLLGLLMASGPSSS